MLKLTETIQTGEAVDDSISLVYSDRQKARLPVITKSGIQVGLFLQRGQFLRSGLVLTGSQGYKVRVEAAPEALSIVHCQDELLFARACYHLGNRHVALQIMPNELRYLADHVLDEMLIGLGLQIEHHDLPFEPEAGAYHTHAS